jgi:hypothetical protein
MGLTELLRNLLIKSQGNLNDDFSESHFEIKHLPKIKPAREHVEEVLKKPILAHIGSKRMARLWHRCSFISEFT